jgi:hypothetical protein
MQIPDFVLYILAGKAYDAYHDYLSEKLGGRFGIGRAKPFEEVPNETRDAWKLAVRTVIEDYPQIDGYDYGDMEDGERVVGR